MSASVQFLDCCLNLIHIPLELYPHFLQAILSLAVPVVSNSPVSAAERSPSPSPYRYADEIKDPTPEPPLLLSPEFVNISVTEIECSVVCSKEAADELFRPVIGTLREDLQPSVVFSEDTYLAIQVDGEGLDPGQRVLEVTSPLALAGISIFFITTYFSDYILVPTKSRVEVTRALQSRGFVFEKHADAFIAQTQQRRSSSISSSRIPPPTPPVSSLSDIQDNTLNTLKESSIVPSVTEDTKLLLCAGRRSTSSTSDGNLHLGLVKALLKRPQFLSVTLTDSEPPSLLLQRDMLGLFGQEDTLLGSKDDVLVPIVLDLRSLPADSTGIVCGVAGRLVGQEDDDDIEPIGMSYLSTTRAGTVVVAEEDIERAMKVLRL